MFFEPSARHSTKLRVKTELTAVEREAIPYELMTFDELQDSLGQEFIFDTECYVNYFLVAFRSVKTKKVCYLEMMEGQTLDTGLLSYIMFTVCSIGFNTLKYDLIMIAGALAGFDCAKLKELSDAIIKRQLRENDLVEEFHFRPLRKINTYDLIEVAPLAESLKKYAARMHAKRLQELPYPENKRLSLQEIQEVRNYCIGADTVNTDLLRAELTEQISLRVNLGLMYDGIDLRSKSDAQIAETVIVSEIRKIKTRFPQKPDFDPDYSFGYQAPAYIEFQTKELRDTLDKILNIRFSLLGNGSPDSAEMKALEVNINGRSYALGIGGLHSMEKSQTVIARDGYGLFDTDVESYYPKLILNNEWFPAHLGRDFLTVFAAIVIRRLDAKANAAKAKKEGDKASEKYWKVIADSLKITINGSFGKLGSVFSMLYSPDLLIQTTVTGQLTLLMIIEACELAGIQVISANTDGFVVHLHESQRTVFDNIVKGFQNHTRLKTEETAYKAIYSRDVNNYIAVKTDGTAKVKGVYSEIGSTGNTRLSKNPECLIIADSLIAFLTKGTPIVETIRNCKDLTRFVAVKQVKGGGHQNGLFLGKTVRWVYGKGCRNTINYVDSGNTVGNSYGAIPLMDLPDEIPSNLDHNYYINEALQALIDIGYSKQPGILF